MTSPAQPKPRQLPLDLPAEPGFSRDELVVTPSNAAAAALIDSWPEWQATVTVIAGPPGAGKTHIASIWAESAAAVTISAADADAIERAARGNANALIDGIGDGPVQETALFHLVNALRQRGGHLLTTSRLWPSQWQIALPDLVSRLKSAPMVEIAEPDDELLTGVIVKLFSDRQIGIDPAVVRYLVSRIERSLATAQDVVARIDRAALESQSRITRQLAASVLTGMDEGQAAFDL